MTADRFDTATELWCYKVTYEDGDVYYYVDVSMSEAARSASEIMPVKSIEEIGKGAIGS
jgi:hypothetical protein